MIKCTSHPDNNTIVSPLSGIVNVALSNPASLSLHSKSGYLWSNKANTWVFGSLVGRTTHYSADGIRQICITPFSEVWYRFSAVLAEVCGHHAIYFQSYKGGVTFGSNRMNNQGGLSSSSGHASQKNGRRAPVKSSLMLNGQESKWRIFLRHFD